MKNIKPKKGRLLISEPSMLDLNFKRSVLLITEHNDNESIAFILNQPTKIKIHDLFEDFPLLMLMCMLEVQLKKYASLHTQLRI